MDKFYMNLSIYELNLEFEVKRKQLKDIQRKAADIETELIGIKEAIIDKTINDSYKRKFII